MTTRKKADRRLSVPGLWIALCALILSACGPSAPITIGNGYVEGVVTADADTAPDLAGTFSPSSESQQKPVATADVTLLDSLRGGASFTRTDADGNYQFSVSEGTYTVLAEKTSKNGTRFVQFSRVVVQTDKTTQSELLLQSSGTLTGIARRSDYA